MRFPLWLLTLVLLAWGVPRVQGADMPPPLYIQLKEKKADQLSSHDTSPLGLKALALSPWKWKHAETDHFIIHFQRMPDAQKVVQEIEYTLWFAAQSLGATKERYAKKSHVYMFEDEREWTTFRSQAQVPKWSASFAHGDNLFLHMDAGFDSELLAHETTHAVVARLYPGQRWPLWLNEGFAEYMSTASMAARKRAWTPGMQSKLADASLPLAKLVSSTDYPAGPKGTEQLEVRRFYESSQKLVRFLMNSYPKDRFPRFVDAMVGGATFEAAIMQVYGDIVKEYVSFTKKYEGFVK